MSAQSALQSLLDNISHLVNADPQSQAGLDLLKHTGLRSRLESIVTSIAKDDDDQFRGYLSAEVIPALPSRLITHDSRSHIEPPPSNAEDPFKDAKDGDGGFKLSEPTLPLTAPSRTSQSPEPPDSDLSDNSWSEANTGFTRTPSIVRFPPLTATDYLVRRMPSVFGAASPTTSMPNKSQVPSQVPVEPDEGDKSFSFDLSSLSQATTIHEFLSTPHLVQPVFSGHQALKQVSARGPRAVEILPDLERLKEVVYLPSMTLRAHEFVRGKDNLEEIQLTEEQRALLSAGPAVANCTTKLYNEADFEYAFRASQGHIVAECLNIIENKSLNDMDRYFPHKGTPGSRPNMTSHAYADVEIGKTVVEMKTTKSIHASFIEDFLDIKFADLQSIVSQNGADRGYLFHFSPPKEENDSLNASVQPVVQSWTQLQEKGFKFGQGSSQHYSFFEIKDPGNPQRLYISRCLSTFPPKPDPDSKFPPPTEPSDSGIYAMFNLVRIASKEQLAEEFLDILRKDMGTPGNLIKVLSRNPELVGTALEPGHRCIVNVSKGSVGVMYRDQTDAKTPALRKKKKPIQDYTAYEGPSQDGDFQALIPDPEPKGQPKKTQARPPKSVISLVILA